ncbi:hypothetical protein Leryth_014285 [Lithospermum erythrorhizon]|nr:hypothetical protein Leryth_014285 [Lithospermum erythrorhizon]
MGCYCSKSPPQPAADEVPNVLAAQTHFTVKDVKALHELFRKLSCSITDDHFISRVSYHESQYNNWITRGSAAQMVLNGIGLNSVSVCRKSFSLDYSITARSSLCSQTGLVYR